MTKDQYRKLTLAEMKSRRWRTARPIQTRAGRIEAGREVRIVNKRNGLAVSFGPCPHCGVSFFAHGVEPYDVEEV